MIEISFGHVVQNDTLHQKKLSIGRGLPHHGQIDFITLVEEDISMIDGSLLWATMLWHFWRKLRKEKLNG